MQIIVLVIVAVWAIVGVPIGISHYGRYRKEGKSQLEAILRAIGRAVGDPPSMVARFIRDSVFRQ